MGRVQQGAQHPLGIGRAEGADVGVEQAHHLGVLAGHTEALPNRPSLAWRAGHIEPQRPHGFQQFLHGWTVGPVHLHREGHSGKECFRFAHVVGAAGG